MSENLNEIRSWLLAVNTLPQCFYGMYARLSLGVSIDGKLQLAIAKSLSNEPVKGRVEAGVARYDNDNQFRFTLSVPECHHIVNNVKAILTGKYVNPAATDEKYKNDFTITHYDANSKPTRLSIKAQNASLKLTVTKDNDYASYVLTNKNTNPKYPDPYEINMFVDFVSAVAKNAIYDNQSFKAKVKVLNKAFFDMQEIAKNSNQNKQQFNNKSNSNFKKKQVEEEYVSEEPPDDLVNEDDDSETSLEIQELLNSIDLD